MFSEIFAHFYGKSNLNFLKISLYYRKMPSISKNLREYFIFDLLLTCQNIKKKKEKKTFGYILLAVSSEGVAGVGGLGCSMNDELRVRWGC